MKSLYINLFHGRVHPEERLEDWGFEGPLVGPLDYVQVTYKDVVRFAFARTALGAKNALAFGFSPTDTIDLDYVEDLAKIDGFYFGDYSVAIFDDREAKVRNNRWFEKTKLKELSNQARFLKGRRAATEGSSPTTAHTQEPLDGEVV